MMNMRQLSLKWDTKTKTHSYTDVISQWQNGYLNTGEALGILQPNISNNLYYPDVRLEREELVGTMIDIMQLY